MVMIQHLLSRYVYWNSKQFCQGLLARKQDEWSAKECNKYNMGRQFFFFEPAWRTVFKMKTHPRGRRPFFMAFGVLVIQVEKPSNPRGAQFRGFDVTASEPELVASYSLFWMRIVNGLLRQVQTSRSLSVPVLKPPGTCISWLGFGPRYMY